MKKYQKPEIVSSDLPNEGIGLYVLCGSLSAETEGFKEYELIIDED